MDVKQKIDFMIMSLEIAKQELEYAESYLKNPPSNRNDNRRFPNATIIRENLKSVARIGAIVSKEIVLSPYCSELYRK